MKGAPCATHTRRHAPSNSEPRAALAPALASDGGAVSRIWCTAQSVEAAAVRASGGGAPNMAAKPAYCFTRNSNARRTWRPPWSSRPRACRTTPSAPRGRVDAAEHGARVQVLLDDRRARRRHAQHLAPVGQSRGEVGARRTFVGAADCATCSAAAGTPSLDASCWSQAWNWLFISCGLWRSMVAIVFCQLRAPWL